VTSILNRLTSGEIGALALEGSSDVGKTAMAVALARHPQVRSYLQDYGRAAALSAGMGNADREIVVRYGMATIYRQ
jgi:hypothetical protein